MYLVGVCVEVLIDEELVLCVCVIGVKFLCVGYLCFGLEIEVGVWVDE